MDPTAHRLTRAIGAGLESALRWLLVLALVFAVAMPVVRVLSGWYVRGRVTLEPMSSERSSTIADLSVERGDPAEVAAIRAAVGKLRYRVDPRTVSVVIEDATAANEDRAAEYIAYLDVIKVQRAVVDAGGSGLDRAVAHEIGHYVDSRYMTRASRAAYMRLRGMRPGTRWEARGAEWRLRPSEDFAEVFATLAQPIVAEPPLTVYGRVRDPAAFESLLAASGIRLGSLEPPADVTELVSREVGFLRDALADPRVAGLFLVLLAAYITYAALPPAVAAWRGGGGRLGTA